VFLTRLIKRRVLPPIHVDEPVRFQPDGPRQMYEEEFLRRVVDAGVPLQVQFMMSQNPIPSEGEEYLRQKQHITIRLTYGEDGWLVAAEELAGVMFMARSVEEALFILNDAIVGHVEAVLDEN
jgi:predicted RNase H-like HicB family nuclease